MPPWACVHAWWSLPWHPASQPPARVPLWTQWGSALRPSLDLSPHEGPAALCLLTRLSQGALWASGSVCSVRGFSSRGLWRPLILGQHLLAATQPQGWARSPCLRLPSAVKGPPVCPRSSFSWLLLTRASGTRPPPCPPLVTGTVSTSHPTLAPGLPSWVWTRSSDPWLPSGSALSQDGRPGGNRSSAARRGGRVLGDRWGRKLPHTPSSPSLRRPRYVCAGP